MASSGKITIRDLTESAKAQKDCYFCAYHSCPENPTQPPSRGAHPTYYMLRAQRKSVGQKRVKPAFDSNMKIDFHQQQRLCLDKCQRGLFSSVPVMRTWGRIRYTFV